MSVNIFLDIDDVIFDWHPDYARHFGCEVPKKWDTSTLMSDRIKILSKKKEFWLGLTLKNRPDFTPKGFVSARGVPKTWTVESLRLNSIPGRSNVHQVKWNESKVAILKELNCDIFVDDKIETFVECLENGVFCLLMDAPHNQHIVTEYRITDLKLNTILKAWHKLR